MSSGNFTCTISLLVLLTIGGTVASTLDTTWWKHTTIYEIYISSFKDSNGDGIGDIRGIIQKLDHFKDLGIETIHITPFYPSPMADLGYDVANFTEIDPLFGTMEDFEELMYEMKRRGLKLLMDLPINHSSDEHPWFQKSVDRIDPYTDYYVWADAKGYDSNGKPVLPNNWWNTFDSLAWEWNEKRGQFYLHQFAIKMPDLNYRNPEVINEMKKILKFWFDKGVSGFRLDAVMHLVEDELLRDEELVPGKNEITAWTDLPHNYMTNLWETFQVIHELKDYVDHYSRTEGRTLERILVAEAYTTLNYTMGYYGSENYGITQFPYNFDFVTTTSYMNATSFNKMLTKWLKNMPKRATANWMGENHDNIRIGTTFDEAYMDIVTMTIMTLPVVACFYYGQEIGMTNGKVRDDQRRDPNNNGFGPDSFRDGQRLPMQWDDSENAGNSAGPDSWRDGQRQPMQWDDTTNAGFSTNSKPWIPVNTNYWKVNVEAQKSDKFSRYNLFKELMKIRKRKTMKLGRFEPYIVSEWVYAFARSLPRHEKYITVLNLGSETESINLYNIIPHLPPKLEVVAASMNAGYKKGDEIQSRPKFPKNIQTRPLSAIVLSTRIHRTTSSRFDTHTPNSSRNESLSLF